MNKDKMEYVNALKKLFNSNVDRNSYSLIGELIDNHFYMIEHMKQTSLYDVYMYKERIEKNTIEPMRILALDNEKLKKEVNELRKQLGLSKKYKD